MPLHAEPEKDRPRFTITEENDSMIAATDRHYSQGIKLSMLSTQITPGGFWDKPYDWFPVFEEGANRTRKYNWTILGQSIFTPSNPRLATPDPNDRPYGAWLYTGVGLLQETRHESHDTLENLEILGGIVGPEAFGAQTQNDFHQFLGVSEFRGWTDQLRDEPGFMITYERKWRFGKEISDSGLGVDIIPEAGVTLGNVMTYGQASVLARFGQNLETDYGPNRVRPAVSGNGWFNGERLKSPFGWYVFAGVQGRAVGHNIFLDGNTYADSPSINKNNFVADFTGGVALFWKDDVRMDFSFTQRTKEFETQEKDDSFGAVNLTVAF
jgi:hypothetical protein